MGAILHLTDLSDTALRAYEHAVALAKSLRYDLHVIHIADKGVILATALRELRPDLAARAVSGESIQEHFGEYLDAYCETQPLEGIEVYKHIWSGVSISNAKDWLWRIPEARLLVVGTRGAKGSLERSIFGTNASRIIRTSEVPVLTVPPEALYTGYKRALIPIDVADAFAERAVEFLGDFLKRWPEMELTFMYVSREKTEKEDELIASISAKAYHYPPLQKATWHVEIANDVREAIISFTEKLRPDLLIMGTHVRTGIERLLEGSLTETFAKYFTYPLLSFHLREV